MTKLLYHIDSYLREMEAAVTRVEGERVVLDRTVFYVQSGGQPADHGTLSWPGGAARVVDVRRSGDEVLHQLDGPVPDLPLSNEVQTHAKVAFEKARKSNLTLRDIYNQIAVARGYLFACGDAAMVADVMEEWFVDRACDGFVLVPPYFPAAFDEFIDLVVPELQRRGIFRREYSGFTLREHLGLPVPTNRYSKRVP